MSWVSKSFCLEAIACGLKTVEARLNIAVPASIDVGHVLKLGHLRCLVKERRVYEAKACNVRAMLEDVGVEPLLPGCGSVEDGVRTYHAIDGFEEGARSQGLVSFFLEVLPPRSACPSAEEAALSEKLCALVRELDGACEDLPEALRELARELMLEREQEQDEWVACIADDDSQADGHKQFARVTEQPRRALQRFTQNRAHEQTVNGNDDDDDDVEASGAAYRCEGGREAVHLAIKKLTQSARKVDLEKARRDIGLASAKAHSTEPAPGFEAGVRAGLRRNDQGRPVWVVPRAGQPLSMFDASF